MKNVYLFLAAFLMMAPSTVKAQTTTILIDSDELKEKMKNKNLLIFQVGNEKKYKKEHIPGAVLLNPSEFTYDDDVKVFDLPSVENLKNLLESKGVSSASEVVIYAGDYIPTMTRFYFTLNYLGLGDKTYILDGGLAAWKAAGGVVTNKIPTPRKAVFNVQPNKILVADKAYVQSVIDHKTTMIIDCRASVYYQGIDVNMMHGGRKGHIKSAKTIPYTSLWEESGGISKFKSLKDITAIFKAQGLKKDQDIVLYCHIGLQLTVVYTAARMLGYENIKVYDASFHEWGADASLPVSVN